MRHSEGGGRLRDSVTKMTHGGGGSKITLKRVTYYGSLFKTALLHNWNFYLNPQSAQVKVKKVDKSTNYGWWVASLILP